MKIEDLNEQQIEILRSYLKWNKIGHKVAFGLLAIFSAMLAIEAFLNI